MLKFYNLIWYEETDQAKYNKKKVEKNFKVQIMIVKHNIKK